MLMKAIDESKYTIEQIFEDQKASDTVERFVLVFHKDLVQQLTQRNLIWLSRTNVRGITYLCNEKKAFMFVDVHTKFVSLKFFTGNTTIEGLIKANWLNKGDNLGSETYRIVDDFSLKQALVFAMKAYEIGADW